MKKTIAAFDFDGTIIKNDSLWSFLKFSIKTPNLILGLTVLSPILILYKLNLFSNWKAKQMLFSYFYKGMPLREFDDYCSQFMFCITKNVNSDALSKILSHRKNGDEVLIISASIENWIKPWADSHDLNTILATKIEIDNSGYITGRFLTPNCYGKEKVLRFLSLYPNRNDYILYGYGDSKGDKELLGLSDYSFYRKFN
ncbi:HAD-IB family hydrolase [Flavobacterium pectinovorum]|uniref:HAD-superfamily subfamily IB hydrolase, TIGR01490 n=1 Tax=Flavobacterium pectinovorum TaxID=29533 RepID=A0AB36P6R6_9FLAO|nr:HAD-IB family hydrolase [Flavobacterium pectinovorum]OXB07593.1 hypothetical protein B0A72_01640 [Flavobacterium pectinovorum]SHM73355.1 HAD-superfamily subfamily IB hydrolase, TIGR01490 [Flavobacterium pectinovorum]